MERLHLNNLQEETHYILEESRIVVPGLQALFGFQLIAVFNESFDHKLSQNEQMMHLCSLFFVALAMILVMTPTALHRIAEHGKLTKRFVIISSRLLKWAMFFLPLGICLDFYLISRMISGNVLFAAIAALVLMSMTFTFWYAFPRIFRRTADPT